MNNCQLTHSKSTICAHCEAPTTKAELQFFKTIVLALVLFYLGGDSLCRPRGPASVQLNSAFVVAAAAAATSHNATPGTQIWQRPGCYQVGHTRTISIPGCVKFSLSTNACRGYCMSFSIPAAEDIGPPSSELVERLVEASEAAPNGNLLNGDFAPDERMRKRRLGGLMSLLEGADSTGASSRRPRKLHQFHLLASSQPRPPPASKTGEKRDVISVGQCCNMMETEDVTVNLRCGLNETRRLVFKSAKTCECFFCKHV